MPSHYNYNNNDQEQSAHLLPPAAQSHFYQDSMIPPPHQSQQQQPTYIRAATDPPNFHRIQKRRHSFTKTSVLSVDYPDDESSTLERGRERLRWCGMRLWTYVRQISLLPCMQNLRRKGGDAVRKVDVTKLALMGLALLALVFMEFGMKNASYYNTSHGVGSMYSIGNGVFGGGGGSVVASSSRRSTGGYQARSQVPIPIEYANFVELAEFVDAVTLVRAHRQKVMQDQHGRRRRLDENNAGSGEGDNNEESKNDNEEEDKSDKETDENTIEENNKDDPDKEETPDGDEKDKTDNDEELNEMKNAIDEAWEQAKKEAKEQEAANPESEQQQQQKPDEETQPEKHNLLKVNHVPFFWHIPRTGGTTLSTLLATCHSLVQATSSFTSPPVFNRGNDEAIASRFRDPTLYVVRTGGEQFVNVDLDSWEGVQRAVHGNLIENELADVVAMPDVRLGSLLFGNTQDRFFGNGQVRLEKKDNGDNGDSEGGDGDGDGGGDNKKEHKGVLFAMFRHPMDRAQSVFYHKQSIRDSVHYDPSLEIYSLADWINSPSYISDYMVRTLVGKIDRWDATSGPFRPPVPLTRDDLDAAKEILRRKCVVGLLEEKGESMKRFEKFFGWNADVSRTSLFLLEEEQTAAAIHAARWKNVKDEECRDRLLHWNWVNKNKHPMLDDAAEGNGPGSASVTHHLLESKNRYDIELYMYARQLFEEQFIQLGFDDDVNYDDGQLDG